MPPQIAILRVFRTFPEFHLVPQDIVFIEANNLYPGVITHSEFVGFMNELEADEMILSERVGGKLKWRITAKGRSRLKES